MARRRKPLVTAKEVLELMELNNWSDAEAADACGVGPRSVERWRYDGVTRPAAVRTVRGLLELARRRVEAEPA